MADSKPYITSVLAHCTSAERSSFRYLEKIFFENSCKLRKAAEATLPPLCLSNVQIHQYRQDLRLTIVTKIMMIAAVMHSAEMPKSTIVDIGNITKLAVRQLLHLRRRTDQDPAKNN